MLKNQIRIIGGQWRSRQIAFPDRPGLRPTPNRVRETLFNWLQFDIPGSRCLDLFAGSGALGFEAASRGAKEVLMVEQDSQVCRALHENVLQLKAAQVKIVQADVFRYLAEQQTGIFDIVFLDPPFGLDFGAQACQWLCEKGGLAKTAKVYVETEVGSDLLSKIPGQWELLKNKTAGDVSYFLFVVNG